jgi:4-amino-4-deoxy-L-arabinose transferase-like glycosyltransferase
MSKITSQSTPIYESPWFIALLFAVLIGPFALDFHMHYPDEMYYSDAAVQMVQNGDYLTTYLGSGELRFKKPVLTYWGVLAGFELFGISPFSSRIFFLLAGAMTVVLVYKIAMVTFSDRGIATLSSLIVASHPVLIFSSTRSIPDIILALSITVSAWGFAGMLRYGNAAPKKYLWLIYAGLALAFQAKGLPAVAIGGLGLLYLLFNPWQRIDWKTLLHLPSIIVAVVIAVFWFVSMYLKFGATYLDSFLGDQVGERVTGRGWTALINLAMAVVLMFALFFPWFFLGLKNIKEKTKALVNQNKAFFWWVALWVIGIILMSALVVKFYERYLLPVTPLAAVGLAWLLVQTPSIASGKITKAFLYFLFGLNVVVLAGGWFLNLGLGSTVWVYLGMVLSAGTLPGMFLGIRKGKNSYLWLSIAMMLIFFNLSFITYQLSLPHQGTQVKQFVAQHQIPKGSKIAFIGHLHTGSKIRIGLGQDYYMTDLPIDNYQERLAQYDYIICEEAVKNQLEENYHVQTASIIWDLKLVSELLESIIGGNEDQLLEATGKRYYWLEKK